MSRRLTKIISIFICFLLIFQQSGFTQIAAELDLSGHFFSLRNTFVQDRFRPLHLRYLSYDPSANNFSLLLDKGDFLKSLSPKALKGLSPKGTDPEARLQQETKTLLNYFFIGISLPNEAFWVNLRPDSPNNIIDPELAETDVGKILLEADLQLKKDTANFTSPQTTEGKEYWDKLYKKAEELYGSENITIPTLTRPWIVPDEIIIRESPDNAYIYKATLKVMLESDYLANSRTNELANYSFPDQRSKALNEYSSQLIRETIIPKLTKEINSSKRYAPLRQVYYSLILAQWFKQKFYGKSGVYSYLIDRHKLDGLTSKTPWSKTTYFNAYKTSFQQGEYNIKEPRSTFYGQAIRSYMSGGIAFVSVSSAISAGIVQSTHGDFRHAPPYTIHLNTQGGSVSSPFKVKIETLTLANEQLPAAGSPVADKSSSPAMAVSRKSLLQYAKRLYAGLEGLKKLNTQHYESPRGENILRMRRAEIDMLALKVLPFVNPASNNITVYYPGAYSDVLGVLAATDAKQIIMLDSNLGDNRLALNEINKQLLALGATDIVRTEKSDRVEMFTFKLAGLDGRVRPREIIYYEEDGKSFIPPEARGKADVIFLSNAPAYLLELPLSNLKAGSHTVMNSMGNGGSVEATQKWLLSMGDFKIISSQKTDFSLAGGFQGGVVVAQYISAGSPAQSEKATGIYSSILAFRKMLFQRKQRAHLNDIIKKLKKMGCHPAVYEQAIGYALNSKDAGMALQTTSLLEQKFSTDESNQSVETLMIIATLAEPQIAQYAVTSLESALAIVPSAKHALPALREVARCLFVEPQIAQYAVTSLESALVTTTDVELAEGIARELFHLAQERTKSIQGQALISLETALITLGLNPKVYELIAKLFENLIKHAKKETAQEVISFLESARDSKAAELDPIAFKAMGYALANTGWQRRGFIRRTSIFPLEQEDLRKKIAVIIHPTEDNNGAFKDIENKGKQFESRGYQVIIARVDGIDALLTALKAATARRRASVIMIGGHGSRTSIQLGFGEPDSKLTIRDKQLKEKLSAAVGTLEENGVIILDSCSTGKGGKLLSNIAQLFADTFPQGFIFTSPYPVVAEKGIEMIFDEDNRITAVEFLHAYRPFGYYNSRAERGESTKNLAIARKVPNFQNSPNKQEPASAGSPVVAEKSANFSPETIDTGRRRFLKLLGAVGIGSLILPVHAEAQMLIQCFVWVINNVLTDREIKHINEWVKELARLADQGKIAEFKQQFGRMLEGKPVRPTIIRNLSTDSYSIELYLRPKDIIPNKVFLHKNFYNWENEIKISVIRQILKNAYEQGTPESFEILEILDAVNSDKNLLNMLGIGEQNLLQTYIGKTSVSRVSLSAKTNVYPAIGRWINSIHDLYEQDGKWLEYVKNYLGSRFCPDEQLYSLLARGGFELYTGTFNVVFEELLKKINAAGGLVTWLDKADPDGIFTAEFLLSLSSRGKLVRAIDVSATHLAQKEAILKQACDIIRNILSANVENTTERKARMAYLSNAVTDIFNYDNEAVNSYLKEIILQIKDRGDMYGKVFALMIMVKFQKIFGLNPETERIKAILDYATSPPYGQIIKPGKRLTVLVDFANSAKDYLDELVKLFRSNYGGRYSILSYNSNVQHGTVAVIRGLINGVDIEFHLARSISGDEFRRAMESGQYSIIFTRHHSYEGESFLGVGSNSVIPQAIGTVATGKGDENNAFAIVLSEEIAKASASQKGWDEVWHNMRKRLPKSMENYLPPNHISFLMSYMLNAIDLNSAELNINDYAANKELVKTIVVDGGCGGINRVPLYLNKYGAAIKRLKDSSSKASSAVEQQMPPVVAGSPVEIDNFQLADEVDDPGEYVSSPLSAEEEALKNDLRRELDQRKKFERIFRHIALGDRLQQLKLKLKPQIKLSQEDLGLMIRLLKNRNPLVQILGQGASGDSIVVFQVPGISREGFGIKDYNDILSYELTTDLINIKRKELISIIQKIIKEGKLNVVYGTYKDDVFLIANELDAKKLEQGILLAKDAIIAKMENVLKDPSREYREKLEKKLKDENRALKDMKRIFPIEIGMSRINKNEDMERARLIADINAHQALVMAEDGKLGIFEAEAYKKALSEFTSLLDDLLSKAPEIFDTIKETKETLRALKTDITAILRKQLEWGAVPEASRRRFRGNKELYEEARKYFAFLKLQDYIKQWPLDFSQAKIRADEIRVIIAQLEQKLSLAQNAIEIKSDILQPLLDAMGYIEQEAKMPVFNSGLVFHSRAPPMEHPTYLHFDIRGLGLLNLREFELELQKLKKASDRGDDAAMVNIWLGAADRVTAKIAAAMEEAKSVLMERFNLENEDIAVLMGGDEFTAVIDKAGISQDDIKKALFTLRSAVKKVTGLDIRLCAIPAEMVNQARRDFAANKRDKPSWFAHAWAIHSLDKLIEALKQNEKGGDFDTIAIQVQNEKWELVKQSVSVALPIGQIKDHHSAVYDTLQNELTEKYGKDFIGPIMRSAAGGDFDAIKAISGLRKRKPSEGVRQMLDLFYRDQDALKRVAEEKFNTTLNNPDNFKKWIQRVIDNPGESDMLVTEMFLAVWVVMHSNFPAEIIDDYMFRNVIMSIIANAGLNDENTMSADFKIGRSVFEKQSKNPDRYYFIFGMSHELGHNIFPFFGVISEGIADITAMAFFEYLGLKGQIKMALESYGYGKETNLQGANLRNELARIIPPPFSAGLQTPEPEFSFAKFMENAFEILEGIIEENGKTNAEEFLAALTTVSTAQQSKFAGSPVAVEKSINSTAQKEVGGIDMRSLPKYTKLEKIAAGSPLVKQGHFPPATDASAGRSGTVPVSDKEWQEIERMASSGIAPSCERIREYLLSLQDPNTQIDRVLACIADILRQEEEKACGTESSLKEILVLLESGKPTNELRLALINIQVLAKEPQLITQ